LAVALSAVFAAVFNPPPPKPGVVGIDLGTSSSAVAVVVGGTPEVVPDSEGHRTMPSSVLMDANGQPACVGRSAGPDALTSTKRLIGRSFDEAAQSTAGRALFASTLERLPDGRAGLLSHGGSVLTSPEEAATAMLGALLEQSEAACGVAAQRAVIGVPAHFTDAQRDATTAAAQQGARAAARTPSRLRPACRAALSLARASACARSRPAQGAPSGGACRGGSRVRRRRGAG
jgi:hypothetical protein